MGFNLGNALKYLWREGKKGNATEDVNKSLWYVNREINRRQVEHWAAFPIDDRYEISTAGRVRFAESKRERALVPLRSGYLTFSTSLNGKRFCHYVHRAVVQTFIGEIPEGYVVAHRSGNRSSNHVTNLRVDTQAGNLRDTRIHGTHRVGARNPAAKLTNEQVVEIRAMIGNESEIALAYSVTRATIGRIRRGESWFDPRVERQFVFDAWLKMEPESDIRSAIELIWRSDLKNDAIEDLKKAAWYINREIQKRGAK
jgi:hypothetical protein